MILPTSRSRAAQPSSRRPMPSASESSTSLWHSAHVMPTDVMRPLRSNEPRTPTTASSWMRRSVTAGSSRFTVPAFSPRTIGVGNCSESTLRPSPRAALGLSPAPTPPFAAPAIARCKPSCPPQKSSLANVSWRNVSRPSASVRIAASPAGAFAPKLGRSSATAMLAAAANAGRGPHEHPCSFSHGRSLLGCRAS